MQKSVSFHTFQIQSFNEGNNALDQIKVHQDTRRRNEKAFFEAAVVFGSRAFLLGLLAVFTGDVLALVLNSNMAQTACYVVTLLGLIPLLLGVVVLTMCPYEVDKSGCVIPFNFDDEMQNGRLKGLIVMFGAGVFAVAEGASFPHTSGLAALPAMWALIRGTALRGKTWHMTSCRLSTLFILWLLLTLGGWGGVQLAASFDVRRMKEYDDRCGAEVSTLSCSWSLLASGTFRVVATASIFSGWLYFRWRDIPRRKTEGSSQDAGATKALFSVGYTFIFCMAVERAILGIGLGDWRRKAAGVIWAVPILLVFFVGIKKMRRHVRRVFESAEAQSDGAFIAELLDSLQVPQSGIWFIWRDEPEVKYSESDYRRFWKKSHIERVKTDGSMTVRTRRRSSVASQMGGLSHSPTSLAAIGRSPSSGTFEISNTQQDPPTRPGTFLSNFSSLNLSLKLVGSAPSPGEQKQTLPRPLFSKHSSLNNSTFTQDINFEVKTRNSGELLREAQERIFVASTGKTSALTS